MRERISQRVSFATAPELNKISGSDVADVSCKLVVTVELTFGRTPQTIGRPVCGLGTTERNRKCLLWAVAELGN